MEPAQLVEAKVQEERQEVGIQVPVVDLVGSANVPRAAKLCLTEGGSPVTALSVRTAVRP